MSDQVEFMYCNYIDVQEVWNIVVPTEVMMNGLRDIEREYGMDQLSKMIYLKCHWPHKPMFNFYTLLRTKVETPHKGEEDRYFLLFTTKRLRLEQGRALVLKTRDGVGLYPVPVVTSGFILTPDATESEKQGNRLIERL